MTKYAKFTKYTKPVIYYNGGKESLYCSLGSVSQEMNTNFSVLQFIKLIINSIIKTVLLLPSPLYK